MSLFVRGLYTRIAIARHPCISWAFLLGQLHCLIFIYLFIFIDLIKTTVIKPSSQLPVL